MPVGGAFATYNERNQRLSVLKAMWHGDDLSDGFHCPTIVIWICDTLVPTPSSATAALKALYPVESEAEDVQMIEAGFEAWVAQRKLLHRLNSRKKTAA